MVKVCDVVTIAMTWTKYHAASKATEAKLKKRRSKHIGTDMPVDDEVAEGLSPRYYRKMILAYACMSQLHLMRRKQK
jgi:hypothetical protein